MTPMKKSHHEFMLSCRLLIETKPKRRIKCDFDYFDITIKLTVNCELGSLIYTPSRMDIAYPSSINKAAIFDGHYSINKYLPEESIFSVKQHNFHRQKIIKKNKQQH
ncbi:CLUMA_CG020815, isoform A [Clunio marinus]|uniref:CLUMA_CG020815, isoform A n=1 Tax=Clunio marinus TaxID=568069 RepID=A0A1J1J638_9DIPT|nr:CLUMA_CG020815, isoform A [Clunio marinus]